MAWSSVHRRVSACFDALQVREVEAKTEADGKTRRKKRPAATTCESERPGGLFGFNQRRDWQKIFLFSQDFFMGLEFDPLNNKFPNLVDLNADKFHETVRWLEFNSG